MFGGKKEKGKVDYHKVIIKGTGLHLIQFSLQCTEETFPVLSGHLRVTLSSWEKYLLSEKVLTFDSNERGGGHMPSQPDEPDPLWQPPGIIYPCQV